MQSLKEFKRAIPATVQGLVRENHLNFGQSLKHDSVTYLVLDIVVQVNKGNEPFLSFRNVLKRKYDRRQYENAFTGSGESEIHADESHYRMISIALDTGGTVHMTRERFSCFATYPELIRKAVKLGESGDKFWQKAVDTVGTIWDQQALLEQMSRSCVASIRRGVLSFFKETDDLSIFVRRYEYNLTMHHGAKIVYTPKKRKREE